MIFQNKYISIQHKKILHQCVDNFLLILKGDTQSIKMGQNNLKMLHKYRNFINVLLAIPLKINALGKVANNQAAVSKMSILYCRTYLKYLQTENVAQVENCLGKMVEFLAMSTYNEDKKIKKYVSEIINDVLKSQKNKLLLTTYLQKLKIELTNVQQRLGVGDSINYEFLGLLTLTVIQAARKHKESIQFLQPTFQVSLKLTCQLVFILQQKMLSKSIDSLIVIKTLNLYVQVLTQYLQIFTNFQIDMRLQLTNQSNILCSIFDEVCGMSVSKKQGSLFVLVFKGNIIQINQQLSNQILQFRSTIIHILEIITNLLVISFNQSHNFSSLLNKNNEYFRILIKQAANMLKCKQYWELSRQQNKFLSYTLQYLDVLISSKLYFQLMLALKSEILFGILIKVIMFSNQDYYQFQENPQEFVNSIYQIIQNEDAQPGVSAFEMDEQSSQKVQCSQKNESSETLKTMSAKIYHKFTQQIDGSLSQLTMICLNNIQGADQAYYKKDTLFLLLSILQRNISGQKELVQKIFNILMTYLRFRLPPQKFESEQDEMGLRQMKQQEKFDMQQTQKTQRAIIYCLALIGVQAFLKHINRYSEEICESLFGIIECIIKNQKIYECIHIASNNLLSTIIKLYKLSINQTKNIMKMFLNGLRSPQPSINTINCLQLVVQINLKEALEPTLNKMKQKQDQSAIEILILLKQIQFTIIEIIISKVGESKTFLEDTVFINKSWKIVQNIAAYLCYYQGFSRQLLVKLKDFSSVFSIQYEQIVQEPVLSLLCFLLKRQIPFNDIYLQFIFKIYQNFLNSEDSYLSLSTSFQFLQHFLFFTPRQTQSLNFFNAIKCIMEMCIYSIKEESANGLPRGQSEMCEGSLLIESIILNAGKFLDRQIWIALMEVLYQRFLHYEKIVYDFFRASLLTNIALIIGYAHLCFQPNHLSLILDMLLKQHYCFTYKDSGKIFTSTIIQLLGQTDLNWVEKNYLKILDCSLTMLKLSQKNGDCIFEGQKSDDQQRYYEKLQKKTMNPLKTVDQFRLFQVQIEKGKQKNNLIVQKSCQSLMQNKKHIFQQILQLRRVGKDVRVIYKIKGK